MSSIFSAQTLPYRGRGSHLCSRKRRWRQRIRPLSPARASNASQLCSSDVISRDPKRAQLASRGSLLLDGRTTTEEKEPSSAMRRDCSFFFCSLGFPQTRFATDRAHLALAGLSRERFERQDESAAREGETERSVDAFRQDVWTLSVKKEATSGFATLPLNAFPAFFSPLFWSKMPFRSDDRETGREGPSADESALISPQRWRLR